MTTQSRTSDFASITPMPVVVFDTAGIPVADEYRIAIDCAPPRAGPDDDPSVGLSVNVTTAATSGRPGPERRSASGRKGDD